jgi:hypothetical protein
MDTKQKCAMALAHRAKPKQTVERLSEAEQESLADLWDTFGESLGPDFATAFDEFWTGHQERLADLKATVDDETEIDE